MIILFMDDDAATRSIGARLLRKRGNIVYEAENPTEALTIFTNHQEVDAAILDIQNNGDKTAGVNVARAIRRISVHVAIVLVSGAPKPLDADEFDYLSKPYEIDDVIRALAP